MACYESIAAAFQKMVACLTRYPRKIKANQAAASADEGRIQAQASTAQ